MNMMCKLFWLLLVSYDVLCPASAANQSLFNKPNIFNVNQLNMYFNGDASDRTSKSTKTGAIPGDEIQAAKEHATIKWVNRIIDRINQLHVNENRTTRAVLALEREIKRLTTYQRSVFQAVRDVIDVVNTRNENMTSPEYITEALFNETMHRMQTDLENLMLSVRNMSKTLSQTGYPTDCNEVFERGDKQSGVYTIRPEGASKPSRVRCEMDGTPWTVLMRRFDGSVDFNRTWNEYKNGFGHPGYEYWAGNEFMHHLTTQRAYKARFDMTLWHNGASSYSEFSHFWVGQESTRYKLSVQGESGTASRGGMTTHNQMKFSTKDRDNDKWSGKSCALRYNGGWWYNNCHSILFTGIYDSQCSLRCSRWSQGIALKQLSIRVTRI